MRRAIRILNMESTESSYQLKIRKPKTKTENTSQEGNCNGMMNNTM